MCVEFEIRDKFLTFSSKQVLLPIKSFLILDEYSNPLKETKVK
jgi:hypothetical protein